VARVLGMARRPFDPAANGLRKTEYRQGDVLDRAALDALAAEADVLVHLAFIIMGGREESRRINLEGSGNVFAAAASAPRVRRLVYTSSVAAYGFHGDSPRPLTEAVPPRGSEEHYYSAEKAELEMTLWSTVGDVVDTYVFRPCIVAGPDALMPVESIPTLLRKLPVAVLPDTGIPFQLVHHDDVATALIAAVRGVGAPGIFNLAGPGELTPRDLARALGWLSVPCPPAAVSLAAQVNRLPLVPAQAQWLNAFRVPMVMSTAKVRRDLRWRPRHSASETLAATVDSARSRGLLTRSERLAGCFL
jgi:UDP-glucose 4-epimerase